MKQIIWLIVLVIVGILAYNFFVSGPTSAEEQELKALEKDFDGALKRLHQAGRMAGLSGMDTTSEAEDVIKNVEKIKEDLTMLIDRLEEEKLLKRAERLEERINKFLRENR